MRKHRWGIRLLSKILVVVAAGALSPSVTPAASAQPGSRYVDEMKSGVEKLQTWYVQSSGLYQTTGWWNSANAITVLANYSRAANTQQYFPVLSHTFTTAQTTSPGFLNTYYDDEGWWALAWIDAYDLTHDARYLQIAESIFADMSGGWDTTTCGGGIWWSKEKTYKNAIANELFLSVAAHLANRAAAPQKTQYADWSKREWEWFSASGMINAQTLINDGLDSSNPKACRNNGQNAWSYNQGVILGGLAEFSQFSHEASLLSRAAAIADAALSHLGGPDGILHDTCEPGCGADGPQFKGIFMRNLMRLYNSAPHSAYRSFAESNADSILKKDQDLHHFFGLVWSGPFDSADAARQSSALDAIIAAAEMTQH